MKVFLGNAPWRVNGRYGVRAGSRWPFTAENDNYIPFPFYLAYAAAVLEKGNVDVKLVDAVAEKTEEEEFIKKIEQFEPGLVLLETSTPSIDVDLRIARRIREACNTEIALCGAHASVMYADIMANNDFIDYILLGEYEYASANLVTHLDEGAELKDVAGLVYRDGGEIRVNQRRNAIDNLDELPWPAWHHLPMYEYNDEFGCLPTPNVQMLTSRGCPYGCIFCVQPQVMYDGTYRKRSPKNVVDEMEFLIGKYDFKAVYFDDDTFNIDRKHVQSICKEIKHRKIDVPWGAMGRADLMDRELLEEMKDAGMHAIKYGIETASQSMLDASGKKLDLEDAKRNIKLTQELGIKVHLTFMFGLPGETRETAMETLDMAMELDPDSAQFSIAVPFPGTKFYESMDEQGFLLTGDWSQYDGACHAVVRTRNLGGDDLEDIFRTAEKTYAKHSLKKKFKENKVGIIKKGLRHPIRGVKKLSRLWFDL